MYFTHVFTLSCTVVRLNAALATRQLTNGEYPDRTTIERLKVPPWLVDGSAVAPLLQHYDTLIAALRDRIDEYVCPLFLKS